VHPWPSSVRVNFLIAWSSERVNCLRADNSARVYKADYYVRNAGRASHRVRRRNCE
jgi:hypothetical protein